MHFFRILLISRYYKLRIDIRMGMNSVKSAWFEQRAKVFSSMTIDIYSKQLRGQKNGVKYKVNVISTYFLV